MSDSHSGTIIPALRLYVTVDDGWSRLEHKIYPFKGWFNWKEAPFYLEYDRGLGKGSRAKYEKFVFESFSFIEDLAKGFPSNISVDENQIISREEISEDEYRKISKQYRE